MRTIAIENLKGGVGKTVTTISLAHILVETYHKRVLVVDCDGQCNLTRFYLCAGQPDNGPTLAGILARDSEPRWEDNIIGVRPGLWLLAASQDLYRLDLMAIRDGAGGLTALREFAAVVSEDGEIDVVLFDCPPGFTTASTAALMAAGEVIIPVLMDGFSIEGMTDMLIQVDSMRQVNPALRVTGVLINQWHRCPAVEQGEKLLRSMPLPVFRQTIRRTEKVPESTFVKSSVLDYSVTSAASRDYRMLCREIFGEEEYYGKV